MRAGLGSIEELGGGAELSWGRAWSLNPPLEDIGSESVVVMVLVTEPPWMGKGGLACCWGRG